MSLLNPGGSRGKGPRVFTASEVERVCRVAKKAAADGGQGSIAGQEHSNSREIARRLRRLERSKGK